MIMLSMVVEAQTTMTPSVGAETSDQSLAVGYDSVQEILRQHCTSCHNEDQPRADLVLTSLDKILAGSASGPVVVPGDPQASPLYLLAAHLESPKMPPNKPRLSQRELTKLSKWISTGPPQGTSPLRLAQVRPLSENNIIRAMAVSPIAPILAIAGNGQVLLVDAQSNTLSDRAIDVGDQEISAIVFSKDGQRLWIAAGTPAESGVLHSWSIPEEMYLGSLGNETDTINKPQKRWLSERHVDCSKSYRVKAILRKHWPNIPIGSRAPPTAMMGFWLLAEIASVASSLGIRSRGRNFQPYEAIRG